jgi:hypothetical protein
VPGSPVSDSFIPLHPTPCPRSGTLSLHCQSWEEKERLSLLYEDERKRNLANPTKIRSVMQVRGQHDRDHA